MDGIELATQIAVQRPEIKAAHVCIDGRNYCSQRRMAFSSQAINSISTPRDDRGPGQPRYYAEAVDASLEAWRMTRVAGTP